MDKNELIVSLIDQIREERGMGVSELARRIGVKTKHLWNVLNHKTKMQIDEFFRICCVLDAEVGYIIKECQVLDDLNKGLMYETLGFEFIELQ